MDIEVVPTWVLSGVRGKWNGETKWRRELGDECDMCRFVFDDNEECEDCPISEQCEQLVSHRYKDDFAQVVRDFVEFINDELLRRNQDDGRA